MASGCGSAKVVHKPRLLSDNGSSYAGRVGLFCAESLLFLVINGTYRFVHQSLVPITGFCNFTSDL